MTGARDMERVIYNLEGANNALARVKANEKK